jgi:hypothetical protein
MLQRIQTVFLMLVALLMLLTLFSPIWTLRSENGELIQQLMAMKLVEFGDADKTEVVVYFPYAAMAIFAILSAITAVISISKFKDRLMQMRLGALNSLFMAGALGCGAWFSTELMKEVGASGNFGIGLFLPGIAMMFNMLANRFIRKDDKLVKSVDRIR